MDFALPKDLTEALTDFGTFLDGRLSPSVSSWCSEGTIPRSFFEELGAEGWLGYEVSDDRVAAHPSLRQALQLEMLAHRSPGVAVAVLVQMSLGALGVHLFGSSDQKRALLGPAIQGKTLLCVGNTENLAGSDVANVTMKAEQVEGGWNLNGTKAFVTNGAIADHALVTAITAPEAPRNRRLSMFIVDLEAPGVTRTKLDKRVWEPADLTRLQFQDVVVPAESLLGTPGRGLSHVLEIFTNSRITISALTLGTAQGAFDMGMARGKRRKLFGQRLIDFQAKSFEAADLFARLEAARLALQKACWAKDTGRDFRQASSVAKYLNVEIARRIGTWAADLYGAVSVVHDHPVHKFPLDAWAASLGEGTQDIQKLIIFRSLMADE